MAMASALIPVFSQIEESRRRQIFWMAFSAGTLIEAVALSFRGWQVSAEVCFAGFGAAVLLAFFHDDSLIKIGNRRLSYMLPRQQRVTADAGDTQRPTEPPADAYLGAVSARNHWWLVAVGTSVAAYGIYLAGWAWQISLAVAVGVASAAMTGWGDASGGFPIARGQKVQFGIASIASFMMFALPLVAYLAGYFGAQKWGVTQRKPTVGRDSGEAQELE